MSVFRSVLHKVPHTERKRFLDDMTFGSGRLININLGPLRGALSQDEVAMMMQECGTDLKDYRCDPEVAGQCTVTYEKACNASACKGNKGGTLIHLGELLAGTPASVHERFLASLDFEKGRLTGADNELLTEHLEERHHAQLPRVSTGY